MRLAGANRKATKTFDAENRTAGPVHQWSV